MFPNEPFDPETVEEQIADLTESLRRNQPQQQTCNARLITHLQQLYQLQQSDPEALEHARERVLQHLEEKDPQSAKFSSSHDDITANTRNMRSWGRVISRQKRNIWHPGLLAAILLVGILFAGIFFFARSALHPSTVHETTPPTAISNGSGGLNISIEPQPFLYQNDLYVNSGDNIRTYAAQNGAPERTYAHANTGDPTIANGILYTSGLTSTSAIRISDGKLLWQAPFGSESIRAPEIVNGVLYGYTYTPDKITYALRISDGRLLWQYRTNNQNEYPNSPVFVQGVVYFTSYIQLNQSIDAQVYALKASDGKLIWQHTLGHTAISELKTDGSTLYVFVDGSIEALRANDGSILWQYHLPVLSEIEMSNTFLESITNGILYIAAADGTIYAVHAASGKLLWHYQTNPGTIFSTFSLQENVLYVGMLAYSASNPYRLSSIVAISISNGLRLWQYQLGEQEILAPTAGQGVIYVIYGTDGQAVLYALRAENGIPLWHRTLFAPQ